MYGRRGRMNVCGRRGRMYVEGAVDHVGGGVECTCDEGWNCVGGEVEFCGRRGRMYGRRDRMHVG